MQHDETIHHKIEDMLRHKIGLNPESVGARAILRAVKKGMRTGKMQGLSDYLSGLQDSPEVFSSLVESVVVPETSFFRNRASFVFLRQWTAREWIAKGQAATRPLRVLSLPCSTGEEPYSIAITLLEEGLSLDQFHIDAVDISQRSLDKAKEGIYSPYAFRRQTYRSDDKYFRLGTPPGATQGKRMTQRYYLIESVRDKVSFLQGNVLDPNLLNGEAPYDIIFCRNLLIYFDTKARDRTFAKLNQLLRPEGLLFLGYAETSMVDTRDYQLVPYPQTFVYRKRSASVQSTPATQLASLTSQPVEIKPQDSQPQPGFPVLAVSSSVSVATTAQPSDFSTSAVPSLEKAQQLADKGEHHQAAIECDRYLESHPSEAAAYLLRGELYQVMDDDSAAEACFEKAIYLNPQLSEALVQLMLFKEANQDTAGAELIRKRLHRINAV